MPGSHTGPIWDHHADGYFCGAVDPSDIKAEIDRAVPLTGSAGSMSFHHVRLLHGSAQNVSDRPRALLLYEYAAADAWPLMGVKDLADFDARLVTGEPSIVPRVTPAPVRMPLPPAIHQGSIYENQTDASRRYFAVKASVEDRPRRKRPLLRQRAARACRARRLRLLGLRSHRSPPASAYPFLDFRPIDR